MDKTNEGVEERERTSLRSSAATVRGRQAFVRLLTLAETRNSSQTGLIAKFLASTYRRDAFQFDLDELGRVDNEISDDMRVCIDALHWGQTDLYRLVPDGDLRMEAVIAFWGLKWPEAPS